MKQPIHRTIRAVGLLLFIFIMYGAQAGAAQTPTAPDFAFPQKVIKTSEADYSAALRKGNDVAALRALIDMTIATDAVDTDNAADALARISKFATTDATTPQGRAIAQLLMARLYGEIYASEMYIYNQRQLPLLPLPADFREWSGEQMRYVITANIDSALALLPSIGATPIRDYAPILTEIPQWAKPYYPLLADFVALQSIQLLSAVDNANPAASAFMPLELLAPYPVAGGVDDAYISADSRRVLRLYDMLLELHKAGVAPSVNYQLSRLDFIDRALRNSGYYPAQTIRERRYDALTQLFSRFADSEYSGDILAAFDLNDATPRQQQWTYDHLNDNIAKFPAYYNLPLLQNRVAVIARKELTIQFPTLSAPTDSLSVKINAVNVNSATLKVYRVNAGMGDSQVNRSDLSRATLVATYPVDFDGAVPFSAGKKIAVSLPECGKYVIVSDFDGISENSYDTFTIINISTLFLSALHYGGTEVVACDLATGAPVKDVEISIDTYRSGFKPIGRTDADGMLAVKDREGGNACGALGDAVSNSIYVYGSDNDYSERTLSTLRIFPSLGIYHPGDSIDCAVVALYTDQKGSRPMPSRKLKISLRNPNWEATDTATVVTDNYGRAQGRLATSASSLTGYYYIEVEAADNPSPGIRGSQHVMVSDYKMPTFEVVAEQAIIGAPAKGDVTLRGRAVTYSGMPVAGARVGLALSVRSPWQWWRWEASTAPFYSAEEVTTDENGNYTFVLPASLFKLSPIPDGSYTARATVVANSGEAVETATSFVTIPAAKLEVGGISPLDVTGPVALNVRMLGNEGEPVAADVDYAITRGDVTLLAGAFSTAAPTVDWTAVPSGTYTVTFACGADSTRVDDVVIYRPTDPRSPSSATLWVPDSSADINRDNTVDILLGTVEPTTDVLVCVNDGRDYYTRHWERFSPALHHYTVTLPDSVDRATITLFTARRGAYVERTITAIRRSALRSITLSASAFRDKITPGAPETWQFTVTNRDGSPAAAAVLIDMYNKALDRLAPLPWSLNPPHLSMKSLYFLSSGTLLSSSSAQSPIEWSSDKVHTLTPPEFNTWGYQLYPIVHIRGQYYMMKSARVPAANAGMEADDLCDGAVECENSEAVSSTADAGGAADTAPDGAADNFSYRPAETPLALFRPMLSTGRDGELTLTFIAPNANTTWCLKAIAYTDGRDGGDMLVSSLARDVISNKPVMVQPNLPRFLRVGDDATIRATVMNNSDSTAIITTVVELFNPADGRVLATQDYVSTLAAGASTTIVTSTGPVGDLTVLGYRVRSSSASFSDGEQAAIPVLSTVQPVMETKTFYSAPDDQAISVHLPVATSPSDRFTLEFTENPLWTVVTALPGLRTNAPSTSIEAASSIYSAAVASSLLRRNPSVAAALHRWTAGERSDSTLTSMLSRNADLKQLLLQATPWMVDAMTDSERMSRLALLFDSGETSAAITAGVDLLAKTVGTDGGWYWASCSRERQKSSPWVTYRVLELLGRLRAADMLPDDRRLQSMIPTALKYIDAEVAAAFTRAPRATFIDYVEVRSVYPEVKMSTAASRAYNYTVQSLIGNWKELSSVDKARAAIILEREGYHSTALSILESLRQYAISSPTAGMTWRTPYSSRGSVESTAVILQAFHAVEPGCRDIDAIRQWLILQKQALNWGTSVSTTAAVSAILTTSPRWVEPTHSARFSLNGHEFTPAADAEQFSGYLRTELPVADASGATLDIAKSAATPAYGAVYCSYSARVDTVAPARCDDLAITKRWYVERRSADGVVWEETDRLTVGDRVRIDLTIVADRDIDYVAINDDRAACFEPVEQLPEPIISQGIYFLRENRDTATRLFIDRLPRGTYHLSYQMWVNNAGTFTSGIATIQSQYAPSLTAHSAGSLITVK